MRSKKSRVLETAVWANVCATKSRYLSASAIFSGLTKDQLALVSESASLRTCMEGTVFYTPGQTGQVLFILKRGTVQIYRMGVDGRKLVTAVLQPVAMFGEMSILGQGMYDSFAEATSDTVICAMSRADVERNLLSNPDVVLRILKSVGDRIITLERTLDEIAFLPLAARLARLLLQEASPEGKIEGLTHQAFAERLGVYRESVSVAIGELRTARIVDVTRKRVVITNRIALERVAAQ